MFVSGRPKERMLIEVDGSYRAVSSLWGVKIGSMFWGLMWADEDWTLGVIQMSELKPGCE